MRTPRAGLAILAVTALAGCRGTLDLIPSDAAMVLGQRTLDAPHPGRPGPHAVRTLTYGSGTDRQRVEFRDSVAFRTSPVDGSKLVSFREDARDGKARRRYWGFGPDSLPLNARVWYPDGDGPFPLVLVVHGNHDMKDYSDPGYDYLGELLASRGFVLASVDMNFINGAIRNENDARGWLLLKHLESWRDFVSDPGNPFHGRVDLDRVALIGHSRGGEAVGHAAAFNRLSRYPDDASLSFDFGFGIRGIIAIAPVDGQYLPADQRVPVENVSYLVFHGSHDGDVTSFHGLRQYNRVRFTDGGDWFKSAVYVYRANHGQWNTVWGPHDSGPRSGRILDLRGLLDPEDQREFARVYVGAFLEATLRDDERYLPLFRDHRVAGDWLPPTMYVTRFEASGVRPLATFEEDIDVTSGTEPGVRLLGDSLSTWKEGQLQLRSANRTNTSSSQLNQAVWLGWNNRVEGAGLGDPARFRIVLPSELPSAWGLGGDWTLELHVGALKDRPPPRGDPAASEAGGATRPERERGERADGEESEEREPVLLSVELVDDRGTVSRLPLDRYGPLRPPLETHVLRRRDQERTRFAESWELLLQHFSIPLEDFRRGVPEFVPEGLAEIRLVFDRTESGTVVVDDIGLVRLPASFLRTSHGQGS